MHAWKAAGTDIILLDGRLGPSRERLEVAEAGISIVVGIWSRTEEEEPA